MMFMVRLSVGFCSHDGRAPCHTYGARVRYDRGVMNEANEKTKFDTSRPFIAIVPGEEEGGYFERTHGVYLVNPLDEPLTNVYEHIGGFFSDDGGVIEATPKTHGPYDVQSHSVLRLEVSSEDELDEFVCWWRISYDLGGEHHEVHFSAGKGLRGAKLADVCPILNRRAFLVGRGS
jgi:hypothetical protein